MVPQDQVQQLFHWIQVEIEERMPERTAGNCRAGACFGVFLSRSKSLFHKLPTANKSLTLPCLIFWNWLWKS